MSRPQTPAAAPKRRAAVLDSPYIQEGAAADDGNIPKKRLKTGSSISTTLKLNARAEIHEIMVLDNPSLSKERDVCVISGMTDEMDVIEYSHVVSRATRSATLDKCEWCWGMDYYTLNLDTRKNLQSLRINLHRFFNKPTAGWLWVPMDLDIMLQFVAFYKVGTREKPTKASLSLTSRFCPLLTIIQQFYRGKTKFSYRLAATPEMLNRHISTYDPSLKPNDPAAFKRHFYPFDTLPKFEINVQPHFVIFNTGFRLEQIFGSGVVLNSDMLENHFKLSQPVLSASLKSCYDLYRVWMSASPPEAFLHSENCPWEDQDAARKPAGGRSAGRNTQNMNPGPLTVDRETMPLGNDTPDGFVDTELVMPDDSISLLLGDDDESQSHQAREEEEEDHAAFFRGVEKWAEDVCEAAEDSAADDHHDSLDSDTFSHNKTLIGNTPSVKCGELEDVTMTDVSLKIGLAETDRHQPPIFHSFWDTY